MNQSPPISPIPDNTPVADPAQASTKVKYPPGLILIIIYVGLTAIFSLPPVPFFSLIALVGIVGLPAVLCNLAETTVMIVLLVGLLRRKQWARILGIAWHSYLLIGNIMFWIMGDYNPSMLREVYDVAGAGWDPTTPQNTLETIFIVSSVMFGVIDGVVTGYLVFRKRCFR